MLAQKFGIAEKTLNNWKADYPEFLQALNAGKDKFNTANVTKSLLQRALGYEIVEKEYKNGVLYRRTVKQVAPDVTACIFWLKNRDPERWRDKQELEHSGDLQINIVHYGNHNSAT